MMVEVEHWVSRMTVDRELGQDLGLDTCNSFVLLEPSRSQVASLVENLPADPDNGETWR
jgi:hypothetical protein